MSARAVLTRGAARAASLLLTIGMATPSIAQKPRLDTGGSSSFQTQRRFSDPAAARVQPNFGETRVRNAIPESARQSGRIQKHINDQEQQINNQQLNSDNRKSGDDRRKRGMDNVQKLLDTMNQMKPD